MCCIPEDTLKPPLRNQRNVCTVCLEKFYKLLVYSQSKVSTFSLFNTWEAREPRLAGLSGRPVILLALSLCSGVARSSVTHRDLLPATISADFILFFIFSGYKGSLRASTDYYKGSQTNNLVYCYNFEPSQIVFTNTRVHMTIPVLLGPSSDSFNTRAMCVSGSAARCWGLGNQRGLGRVWVPQAAVDVHLRLWPQADPR